MVVGPNFFLRICIFVYLLFFKKVYFVCLPAITFQKLIKLKLVAITHICNYKLNS